MAVEKLDMLKIVGDIGSFDEFVDKYIIDSEIQVENAADIISATGVHRFHDKNPYLESFRALGDLCSFLSVKPRSVGGAQDIDKETVVQDFVSKVKDEYTALSKQRDELKTRLSQNGLLIENLNLMGSIDKTLEEIFSFEFVKIRFGRLSRESYEKLNKYLEGLESVFFKCRQDEKYVYGMYFAPRSLEHKVDDIFISLNFERIRISAQAKGTPKEAIAQLETENEQLRKKIAETEDSLKTFTKSREEEILRVYSAVKRKYDVFAMRELAVHTEENFYLICWAQQDESKRLKSLAESENKMLLEVSGASAADNPPTLLKNSRIFKPFESMVKLYSLPTYTELDPTPIMAITYVIMFGMMFGDIGQGLVLAIAGFILYKTKKIDLAAVVSMAGVSAAFFGWVYGSIFGLEDVVKPLWLHPSEETSTILIAAVATGAVIIVMSMLLSLVNSVRTKNWGELLFSQNGIAGLVFYVSAIGAAYCSIALGMSISAAAVIFLFVLPLAVIFLKQPLSNLLKKRKKLFDDGAGSYFTESAFEMFEVCLSYITNTVSFIRIGAFALVHAGMMLVVMTLAQMSGTVGHGLIFVLGNIFIMCLEALLVGIQTLRLEFYEIFSRFYTGGGREFKTLKNSDK